MTRFHNRVTTPLPSDIPPAAIVALLHDHSYVIHTQPLVTGFTARPESSDDQSATANHASTAPARNPGFSGTIYDVTERIPLLPFGLWSREIRFTAAFRDTRDGVVSRVEAPLGFTSEATYVVRRREMGDGEGDVDGDWTLHEAIDSECAAVFKMFVQGTMVPVRRKMHEGMIARVREQRRAAKEAGGDGPAQLP